MTGVAVPTDSTNERLHRQQLARAVNQSLQNNSASALQSAQALALANTVAGDLLIEALTRGNADDVINSTITSLTSTVSGNTASITTESATRAGADIAIAATVTALTATVGTNTANITTESGVRATADSALASSITSLTATVGTNTANITTEATARASADGAIMADYGINVQTMANGTKSLAGLKLIAGAPSGSQIQLVASKLTITDDISGSTVSAAPFTFTGGNLYLTGALYANAIFTDQLTVGTTLISNSLMGANSVTTTNVAANSITFGYGAALIPGGFVLLNHTADATGDFVFSASAGLSRSAALGSPPGFMRLSVNGTTALQQPSSSTFTTDGSAFLGGSWPVTVGDLIEVHFVETNAGSINTNGGSMFGIILQK